NRSTVYSTHGRAATAHDMLGKSLVEMIGPHKAYATAPSVAAGAEKRRANSSHAPQAASGNGTRTHRLNPSTSGPINRTSTDGSRNIWWSASATADWPAPTYGSQSGQLPDSQALR